MAPAGEKERWHVKKEISLGDVIAIIVSITAILGAYARLDNRISLLEQSNNYTQAAFSEIKFALTKMSDKIDRILERNGK